MASKQAQDATETSVVVNQTAAMVQVADSAQGLAKLAEELQLNVSTFRL